MNEERIRGLLAGAGAVDENLFCTIHRVENDRLVTLFSSHPVPERLGSWQHIGDGVVGRAVATGQILVVNDVRYFPDYVQTYPSTVSELAIPVIHDNQVIAVINFESTAAEAFDGDFRRFEELAGQLQEYFLPSRDERFDALLISEDTLWRPKEQKHVNLIMEEISDAFLRRLAGNPQLMHQLSSRKFEELVARVLSDLGLKVTLTPPIKDGGFDMLAELATPLGTVLTLVECKKYSPTRPVSVEVVRNLYGVLNLNCATQALIATTSRFTADARALQDAVKYRLELRDYQDIAKWLIRYEAPK